MKNYKQVVLILLSGWGIAPPHESNVLSEANIPQFKKIIKEYPTALLKPVNFSPEILSFKYTSSELANLSIGTGEDHLQVIASVDKKISTNDFIKNKILINALEQAKLYKSKIHLVGMLGEGRINASQKHLYALLNFFNKNNFKDIIVHGILDGEDEAKESGLNYVQDLLLEAKKYGFEKNIIGSLSGRYYAMDRGENWNRTWEAYKAIVGRQEISQFNPSEYIKNNYEKGCGDFDIKPACFMGQIMQDNDVVIFFNSRPDYLRQLAESITLPSFAKFERSFERRKLFVATLIEYEKNFPAEVILKDDFIDYSLAKILRDNGLKQIKISEVDKYPHTTYHFNGLSEQPCENEEWKMVVHDDVIIMVKKV